MRLGQGMADDRAAGVQQLPGDLDAAGGHQQLVQHWVAALFRQDALIALGAHGVDVGLDAAGRVPQGQQGVAQYLQPAFQFGVDDVARAEVVEMAQAVGRGRASDDGQVGGDGVGRGDDEFDGRLVGRGDHEGAGVLQPDVEQNLRVRGVAKHRLDPPAL